MAKPNGPALPLHIRLALLYAGAALLLASGLLVGTQHHAADSVRAHLENLLARSAQVGALQIDLLLSQVQASGQEVLHGRPATALPALRAALTDLVRRDNRLWGALVYSRDGTYLLSTPPLPARSARPPSVSAHARVSFGRIAACPDPVVFVPVRHLPANQSAYRLVLLVRLSALERSLNAFASGGLSLQLVDLSQSAKDPGYGPIAREVIAEAVHQAPITPAVPLFQSIARAHRTREAPWAVVATMPTAQIAEAARKAARHVLPWALLGILGAGLAGVATAIWVTYPLHRLTASAARLAAGALTERTGIRRRDEIGQLAAAFDAMAEELCRKWNENTELYLKEQRRTQMLRALEKVAQAVNSTLSLDKVLETILHQTYALTRISRCAITLKDDTGEPHVYCASGIPESLRALLEKTLAADPSAQRAFAEQRTVAVQVSALPSEAQLPWRREGIATMACAPMILADQVIGGLHVYESAQQPLTEEQLEALSALAGQAAIAVQNARLFEQSLRTTREVRVSFRRIGAALASGLNLDDTLALIAELACEMLHADACLIQLIEHGSGDLVARASYGLAPGATEPVTLRIGEGLSGHVAHTASPLVVEDVSRDSRTTGFLESAGIRAYLGVPLRVKSRVFGVLSVFKRSVYQFSSEEVELLSSFGAQASVALENRRLWQQERRVARTLQRSLLPAIPPTLGGLELGELYIPAQREADVGGDFYDLFALDHGRIGAIMGDVCGKGIRAAVYTAMAKYAIRSYALDDANPASVMHRTNRALCRQIAEESMFVSIVYALIDTHSPGITVANAGHPYPLHFHADTGTVSPLVTEGTLAGLIPNARFTETYAALQSGDVILLYTDGVIEARQGNLVWGTEALAESLARHAAKPADRLVDAIARDARSFANGALSDDIAMLAIKVP